MQIPLIAQWEEQLSSKLKISGSVLASVTLNNTRPPDPIMVPISTVLSGNCPTTTCPRGSIKDLLLLCVCSDVKQTLYISDQIKANKNELYTRINANWELFLTNAPSLSENAI